jgi:hypothetical protein
VPAVIGVMVSLFRIHGTSFDQEKMPVDSPTRQLYSKGNGKMPPNQRDTKPTKFRRRDKFAAHHSVAPFTGGRRRDFDF